jgi:hypothetical protein
MAAKCERTPDGWSVRADVTAIPVMYLTSTKLLSHESLHIADFRFYLGKHVKALEERNFATRQACDALAATAMASFNETFQSVGRISAGLRDNKRDFRSEDQNLVMKAEFTPQLVAAAASADPPLRAGLVRTPSRHLEGQSNAPARE